MTLTTADNHPIELAGHYWLWSNYIGTYDCITPIEIGGFVCDNHQSPSIRYKYRVSGDSGAGFNQDADRSLVYHDIRILAEAIEGRQGARLNRYVAKQPEEATQ